MATSFDDAWQIALQAEQALSKVLAEPEPTFADISHSLGEFRTACQNAIFADFVIAHAHDVEGRLWDAHIKINNRFRRAFAKFGENGTKKVVERRKLGKHFLDFIKSSQRFYRGYIQRLSSRFGGIPELEHVARSFNFPDDLSLEPRLNVDQALRKLVLSSCHATLIRLGDLSRYRETQLVAKNRKWGPAIGHYDLAMRIYPDSGASHNQLAVIAWEDGSHLRAMYHLYRAVSARIPHPTSEGNLEAEFRKVFKAWERRQLIPEEDAGVPSKALIPYFIYLHARCYNGVDFPNHDELEGEVMNQLAVDLKERSLDGALQKIVLINIAAEAFAEVRSTRQTTEASEEKSQGQAQANAYAARQFFQRINVKTFFTLLQVLLAELERSMGGESDSRAEKVTVVARRILPALRNYSSWLLQNVDALTAQRQDKETPLSVQIKEFWKIYASTMTLLTSTFDVAKLPEIDYLLEEDEDTLGFTPLMGEATNRRYMTEYFEGLKPRIGSPGVERNHPNLEMLFRIRDFVIDGLNLVFYERIPVVLVEEENDRKIFVYKEDLPPTHFFHNPQAHQPPLTSTDIGREDIPNAGQPDKNDARSAFGDSHSASVSMSTNMNGIVEGVARLVESDTYESAPPMTDGPDFLKDTSAVAGPPPISRGPEFTPRDPNGPAPPVPPGLGPREDPQPSQSYTPRPALPGIHSIWSTNYSSTPDGSLSTQGFPSVPGTGPRPVGSLDSRPQTTDETSPSYLELQRKLSQQRREIHLRPSTTFDPSSSYPSVTAVPATPQAHHLYGYTQYSLPNTSDMSWADRAFIASSSIPQGSGASNTHLRSGHESTARYGVIGQQTPPCGHGG